MKPEHAKIIAKIKLNLPLTKQERAIYLLFIATLEQATEFLKNEGGDI